MKGKARQRLALFRKIFGDLCAVLSLLLTLDVAVIMCCRIAGVTRKATYGKVFLFELLLCGILLFFSLDLRFNLFTRSRKKAARAMGWLFRIAVVFCTAAIVLFCGKVTIGSLLRTTGPAHSAILLGQGLENGKPSKNLLYRVNTAEKWLKKNPNATVVLAGGNPDGDGKTEAAVMYDLLLERGVAPDRMILEEESENTEENLAAAAKLIPTGAPVMLITSGYHMDRAAKAAKKAGFQQIARLPAPSDPVSYGADMLWEVSLEIEGIFS